MTETITTRIDNVTLVQDKYQQAILPAPPSCKIELTSRCNFECGFCAHRLRMKKQATMDFEFYKRITKEMLDCGVEELGLFYIGESLLCPWLEDAIKYAKDIGYSYVFLTTNGSLMLPDTADKIMSAGLDSLKFSYNYSDADQFEHIAQVSPRWFEQMKKNIKNTFEIRKVSGYKTKLYASSIMFDGEQQKKMEAAVNEILPYVDQHYWLPLYSFGSLAEQREKELGYRPTAGNQGRIGALRQPLPCWSAFKEAHITCEGKLSACCFDAGSDWEMADLTKTGFMDGWNSEKYQKLRTAHLNKDVRGTACEACVAYK